MIDFALQSIGKKSEDYGITTIYSQYKHKRMELMNLHPRPEIIHQYMSSTDQHKYHRARMQRREAAQIRATCKSTAKISHYGQL